MTRVSSMTQRPTGRDVAEMYAAHHVHRIHGHPTTDITVTANHNLMSHLTENEHAENAILQSLSSLSLCLSVVCTSLHYNSQCSGMHVYSCH